MDGVFRRRRSSRKKLIERDPIADLAASYAPFGILPGQIRKMSPGDRTILRIGRSRYFETIIRCIQAGVAYALNPPKEGEPYGEE